MKILYTDHKEAKRSVERELPENLIVFSHLRWDFVYQRPQHILTRLADVFNVIFIEEPVVTKNEKPFYSYKKREGVVVVTPHVSDQFSPEEIKVALKTLFDEYMANKTSSNYAFWYYTPMALEYSRKFMPALVIYDCMDELSAFKFAPTHLKALEQELLKLSDVVFTGGRSLYEAKKNQHSNIHLFPSSIDRAHFATAREIANRANRGVEKVTLGFYGVIDERFDAELIAEIAVGRPEWNIEIIGPVVKIDKAILPSYSNIKYLGAINYQDLPHYVAEWDIALIPFLLNDSTRFISPTKTPEYLAAGLPVVSTAIRDVINPYAVKKMVKIGANAAEFIQAVEYYMSMSMAQRSTWLKHVDQFLSRNSWDNTCSHMLDQLKTLTTSHIQTSVGK